MKNIIKKWWFWVIVVSLLIIMLIILFGFILNKKNEIGTAGISKSEFEEIDFGMSQFKVHSIIDKNDEWDNDNVYEKCCEEISKNYKDNIYTYKYKYYGEKNGYALITYTADYSKGDLFVMPEVTEKEQFGLK